MDRAEAIDAAARLFTAVRWGALATVRDDASPLASQVAAAPAVDAGAGILLMHLSELAEHTRNLLARPGASLVLGEPDTGRGDPQVLARIGVHGDVAPVDRAHPGYAHLETAYLARLPRARPRFEFGDFGLYALRPRGSQLVGGFARAFALDRDATTSALAMAFARASRPSASR